jgi:hypothetical protein
MDEVQTPGNSGKHFYFCVRFEVFTAMTVASSGMLRRVVLVRTDVSEERSATIIRLTRIGELGTSR